MLKLPSFGTDQCWHTAQVIKHDLFVKPNQSPQSHRATLLIHKPDEMLNLIRGLSSF